MNLSYSVNESSDGSRSPFSSPSTSEKNKGRETSSVSADATLVVLRESTPAGEVRDTPLAAGEYLLGRGEEVNYIVLSPDVSRIHGRLVIASNRVSIRDLGSKNGILMGGVRIDGEVELREGACFEIGSSRFEIRPYKQFFDHVVGDSGEPTMTRVRGPSSQTRGDDRSPDPSSKWIWAAGAALLVAGSIAMWLGL
jgi:S-DNA-T family DNA segregation ATPase FtsK/SpoIIIE